MLRLLSFLFSFVFWSLISTAPSCVGTETYWAVGAGRIDITPDYPVRLAGYASRTTECEGIAQRIWAKAIAIGTDGVSPAILITVDNCGVPANVREAVVQYLASKGIRPERITICSTHSHSTPWLTGYLSNLFSGSIPQDQQARVQQYTHEVIQALCIVAERALDDRRPSRISWGRGHAGFAANRRTTGGPVDQELPTMFVTDPAGQLRVVFTSYACHCTTLTGEFNQVCGDWAGYAQEFLESDHPGALALVAIGCAGDANPKPRPGFDLARQHGRAIADAANEVLKNGPTLVNFTRLRCRQKQIDLPLAALPNRAEWENRAKQTNYAGLHARLNLARLDRGEKLTSTVPYRVQTWVLGDSLAMIFLAGEVVVDYSTRLKQEFDRSRLWVNAYANDVPCYIASERILREGGYEGDVSMIFYDKPAPFAPGVEELVIQAVHDLMPKAYESHRP